jgi:prepilin-type N-terminal cleavage/methylation domain-containing protein
MYKKQSIKAFSLIELSVVILVVGLLTLGITQGSRIIKSARLQSAIALTKSSPVNSIGGLVFWLDVTDNATISSSATCATAPNNYGSVADGYFVNKWDDKNPQSPTKITTVVAANTNCPIYTEKGIGNLPSLKFDGINDALQSLVAPISAGNKNITTFAVIKRLNTGSVSTYLSQYKDATGNTDNSNIYLALSLHTLTNVYPVMTCGGPGGNCFSERSALVPPSTNPYVLTTVLNSETLSATFYLNGASFLGNAGIWSNWNLGNGFFLIGSKRDNSVNNSYFNGYISEIIIFNQALKASEINSVNQYLMTKYSF